PWGTGRSSSPFQQSSRGACSPCSSLCRSVAWSFLSPPAIWRRLATSKPRHLRTTGALPARHVFRRGEDHDTIALEKTSGVVLLDELDQVRMRLSDVGVELTSRGRVRRGDQGR